MFSGLRNRLRGLKVRVSAQLRERLLVETGVGSFPGSEFGRPPEESSVRLAYVGFDDAKVIAATREISPDKAQEVGF